MILIGIDPGRNTGYAVWDAREHKFLSIQTVMLHVGFGLILQAIERYGIQNIRVVFEDARLRGNSDYNCAAVAQGAGSVKRDCSAWDDFLRDMKISFEAVSPKAKGRKVETEYFKRLTKWEGRTSAHGRDAGMLVFGRRS